mmetsp:Transcript_38014/g.49928  ORF Transcript_38014/g.49928 Transcript_38014/m.49928 type:complete len:92 (+) Transcript_38014:61-336(+)
MLEGEPVQEEECEALLPQQLEGDSVRLQQVMINLTKNALKFTLQGSICIYLAYEHSTELLHALVSDTGKGILAEEIGSLFTRFGKLRRTAD